jgi:hypothetical protein
MSYIKQMQRLADEFYEVTGKTTASTKEMAKWAISTGKWQRHEDAALRQCAQDFADALREDYDTNPKTGRRYRTKHVAPVKRGSKSEMLWADMKRAAREFMESAFRLRRNQIVGDCYQLKQDVDTYNDRYNKGEQILLPLDFTPDVEEMEEMTKEKKAAA